MKTYPYYVAVLLLCTSMVQANPLFDSDSLERCLNSAESTKEKSDCLKLKIEFDEKQIVRNYKDAYQVLPNDKRKKLKESQVGWEQYRARFCDLEGNVIETQHCWIRLNELRIAELESLR